MCIRTSARGSTILISNSVRRGIRRERGNANNSGRNRRNSRENAKDSVDIRHSWTRTASRHREWLVSVVQSLLVVQLVQLNVESFTFTMHFTLTLLHYYNQCSLRNRSASANDCLSVVLFTLASSTARSNSPMSVRPSGPKKLWNFEARACIGLQKILILLIKT